MIKAVKSLNSPPAHPPCALLQIVKITEIPDGWMGLDIGPDSIKTFQNALADCKTVVWNGPMGVFEFPKFAAGTTVGVPGGRVKALVKRRGVGRV